MNAAMNKKFLKNILSKKPEKSKIADVVRFTKNGEMFLLSRIVPIAVTLLADIFKEYRKIIGPSYKTIIYEGAKTYTKKEIEFIEKNLPDTDKELTFKRMLKSYLTVGGGVLKNLVIDKEKKVIIIQGQNLAEAYGWEKSDEPVCHLFRGYVTAYAQWLFGTKMEGKETMCMAKRDPYCEFIITEKK